MKTEDFLTNECNIEITKLDRKIVIDQSRLLAILDKHKEAINYTHSCKSDSELLLKKQSDWLMIHTKLEVENIVSFTEEFKQ